MGGLVQCFFCLAQFSICFFVRQIRVYNIIYIYIYIFYILLMSTPEASAVPVDNVPYKTIVLIG